MSRSRTVVKFRDSQMGAVIEDSPNAILEALSPDEVIAEQQAAAAATVAEDPRMVAARDARSELFRLHESALVAVSEAASAVETAKVEASEIAGRDSFDRGAYVAAAARVTELEAVHAGLLVRADAVSNRVAVAEREFNVALEARDREVLAVQVAEYNAAVGAMDAKLIASMREAWRIAQQVSTLPAGVDVSFVWGSVAAAEYLVEWERLSASATALSANGAAVNSPAFIGAGTARLMFSSGTL